MIFIGDLYQLPPVVNREEEEIFRGAYSSPYFFAAKIFEMIEMEFIDLEKIYRQTDDEFIDLLGAIRNNTVTAQHLHLLNQRYLPDFEPSSEDLYIYLTTTNALAERINHERLARLDGRVYLYTGRRVAHLRRQPRSSTSQSRSSSSHSRSGYVCPALSYCLCRCIAGCCPSDYRPVWGGLSPRIYSSSPEVSY